MSDERGGPLGRITRRYQVKAAARGYQAGMEAVAALAISAVAGAWLDSRLDTAPVLMLVGMGIGFGACVLRLLRYQRAQEALAARSDAQAGQEPEERGSEKERS